jgi:hypothetical protein
VPAPDIGPDGTGVTVCMHVRDYQATAASMVAELPADPAEPIRIWSALGSPCSSVYVPVPGPREPGVRALADPVTWARFDALRRRTESQPDGLAEVRAVLAPVEAALWSTGGPDWPAVDEALHDLGV